MFAAVLIRNNGVIAVTAQPYDSDDGSGKVEVLASYLGNGESLTISQPTQLLNVLRNVFISQNPRDSNVRKHKLVDPQTLLPDQLKGISGSFELLTTFLTHIW